MEKINLVELLKDCPTGMELDCTMYDDLVFVEVDLEAKDYPITTRLTNGTQRWFTSDGRYELTNDAKCVIFPKGKTTWKGFVPPCKPCEFKDGDMVYIKTKGHNHNEFIIIFKEIRNDHIHKYACFAYQHLSIDKCALCHLVDAEIMRLATEEEKQKLFDAIKANGYQWNTETKTLEKLVPNKFDITTLKPFESRVLVRDNDYDEWKGAFWSHLRQKADIKYDTIRGVYRQCIPYNDDTKHLLGKTNSCDDYYKTWK